MTIGQRIFALLKEKGISQKEFSTRTGIATTTISDWRKKNTNPGSDKILSICSALDVTPEYLLTGITEDSSRGKGVDYMILPKGTQERELIEIFNDMSSIDRTHLLEYAKKINESASKYFKENPSITKIAEFDDIEIYMDSLFEGNPCIEINYLDDDIHGRLDMCTDTLQGNFSKYVKVVIEAWYQEHKSTLLSMWNNKKLEIIPEWV